MGEYGDDGSDDLPICDYCGDRYENGELCVCEEADDELFAEDMARAEQDYWNNYRGEDDY